MVEKILSKKILNIPNSITLFRLFMAILCIYSSIHNKYLISFISFLLFAICDFIDGYVARKLKQETIFGSIFDTTLDTTFILACLILLIHRAHINPFILIVIYIPKIISFSAQYVLSTHLKKIIIVKTVIGRTMGAIEYILLALTLFILINPWIVIIILIILEYCNGIYHLTKLVDSTKNPKVQKK